MFKLLLNSKVTIPFWLVVFILCAARLYAQNICVEKAGIKEADGIYMLSGSYNDRPLYVKGNCEIRYKGCRSKWGLLIDGKMIYKNRIDIEECPFIGWETTCANKKDKPEVPVFKFNKAGEENKNSREPCL